MPRPRVVARALAAGVLAAVAALPASAEKPLWELGVGVAPLSFPAYRGAEEQRGFVFPVPWVVYRGERFRVDRGGARGLLFDSEDVELDVSFDGAIPVESSNDGPRAGMAELDPVLELGPSLKLRLADIPSGRLEFRLPVRAAVAVGDGSTSQKGWKVQPQLGFNAPGLVAGWDVGASIGPKFATRAFHAYYYDVGSADVRPGRPAFEADGGGYSGLGVTLSASRRFDRFWLGAFLRYDNLSGAVFEDSPLVETRHAVSAGFAVSWILWQSRITVSVDGRDAGVEAGR